MEKTAIGKTALITGGSRGIGRGIALAMAQEGYDVAISHWNDHSNADQVKQTISEKLGQKCYVFHGNLEDESSPEHLTKEAIEALGRIDVLVNNAGVTIFNDIKKMDVQQINKLINLNLRAPLLLMKSVGSHMQRLGIRGSMVNITSSRAERAYPVDAVYGGLKAALARSSQSVALEFAEYGIRINCVAPGAISTTEERAEYFRKLGKKIPLNRPGTPEDIAKAVMWLASDQSSYITGTTIRADGGLILPGMPETVESDHDFGWGRNSN